MFMKQLGKLLNNLPAESMIIRLPFQSTKQDTRCYERRKQYQTDTYFHHPQMPWRCILLGQISRRWNGRMHYHISHGCIITDESIKIHWMNQKPAPEVLEELTSCCCKKSKCRNKMCKCKAEESAQTFGVALNAETMVQEKMMTSCQRRMRIEKQQVTIMVNLTLMMTGN